MCVVYITCMVYSQLSQLFHAEGFIASLVPRLWRSGYETNLHVSKGAPRRASLLVALSPGHEWSGDETTFLGAVATYLGVTRFTKLKYGSN